MVADGGLHQRRGVGLTQLLLSPVDVWLFRDGRPFTAGDDHRAESVFPPFPSVVQGAIRSHHLIMQKVDLLDQQAIEAAVGTTNDFLNLRIRGPFLAREEGKQIVRYYPQPADAKSVSIEKHTIKQSSHPEPTGNTVISSQTSLLIGLADPPEKGEASLWLSEQHLHKYFAGQEVSALKGSELFDIEALPGNRIETGRGVTADGALYEIAFIRPKGDVGLNIEIQGYQWPSWSGTLSFGGERRAAHYKEIEFQPTKSPIPETIPNRFMVYFATPAYFEYGWQPKSWDAFFHGGVQLKAAAVGRYQSVGGFDYSKKRGGDAHKPSRRFVPAGSLYYFEANTKPSLKKDALSDFGAEIGFGQIIIPEEGW